MKTCDRYISFCHNKVDVQAKNTHFNVAMIQLKDGARVEIVDPNSLELMSDQEILSLVDLQMMDSQDRQLSWLLDKQQAGTLSAVDSVSLNNLMAVYQEGLACKANALQDAVKRGLMDPLAE